MMSGQIKSYDFYLYILLGLYVMVNVLVSSAVDRGFEPGLVKPKTKKLVFVASSLITQH